MANRLVISNIGLLATPLGRTAAAGPDQGRISQRSGAYLVAEEGVITALGNGQVPADLLQGARHIDAGGRLVTPRLSISSRAAPAFWTRASSLACRVMRTVERMPPPWAKMSR